MPPKLIFFWYIYNLGRVYFRRKAASVIKTEFSVKEKALARKCSWVSHGHCKHLFPFTFILFSLWDLNKAIILNHKAGEYT